VNPVTLLIEAVGPCTPSGPSTLTCQSAATGAEVARGNSATLLLAGEGIVCPAGTTCPTISIAGSQSGVTVTQPAPTDFRPCKNSTTPCVTFDISVSASAALGPRNIVVTNPAGEMSVFVGGLEITQ